MKIQSNLNSYNSYQRNSNPNFKAQLVPKIFYRHRVENNLSFFRPSDRFCLLKNAMEDYFGCNRISISLEIEALWGDKFSNLILKQAEAQELEKLKDNPELFLAKVKELCNIEKQKYETKKPNEMTGQYYKMIRKFKEMTEILNLPKYEVEGEHDAFRPFTEKEMEEAGQTPEMILNKMFNRLKNLLREYDENPSKEGSIEGEMSRQGFLEWYNEDHVKKIKKEGAPISIADLVEKKKSAMEKVEEIILELLYSDEERVPIIA